MKLENRQLILERKNCNNCRFGTVPTKVNCVKCNGTGNGPRGGKRGCRKCYGSGYEWDQDNRQTCSICNGDYENFLPETPFNHIRLTKDDIRIKVIRDYAYRQMSFTEQYIGAGLFSCTDYGRHQNQTDDELIESAFHFEEKGEFSTQGIKLIRDKNDLRICDYIGIVTADNGYSVIPIFEED